MWNAVNRFSTPPPSPDGAQAFGTLPIGRLAAATLVRFETLLALFGFR
jgi:hypothetical protein